MNEIVTIIEVPREITVIEDGDGQEIVEVFDEITEVTEIAEQGLPGVDGHAPTDEELIALIEPLIPPGSDANYIHPQISAASVWTVNHNLGKYPSVMVVDSGDTVVYGDINYIDTNSLTITFNAAFGGRAFLN